MKQSVAVRVASAIIVLFSFSYPASADVTPTPAPTSQMDVYKSSLEQFKKDRDIFNAAMRERNQKIRVINQIFDSSIRKARQDSKLAMQAALKPEQKSAVNSNLRSVIATAVIARESAIEALGEPPVPPIEPLRPPKSFQGEKMGIEKKRR
ncbi:hypothetical protein MCEMRE26_01040 [Candidatus Nanopelagicaceae bacterium]